MWPGIKKFDHVYLTFGHSQGFSFYMTHFNFLFKDELVSILIKMLWPQQCNLSVRGVLYYDFQNTIMILSSL